jgi:hypothetical protein
MSLEHRKRALDLGMAERRQEISVQMELMQASAGGRPAAAAGVYLSPCSASLFTCSGIPYL